MTTRRVLRRAALAAVLVGALAASSAWAGKPEWAGKGKDKQEHEQDHKHNDRHDAKGRQESRGGFSDAQRSLLHGYYSDQMRAGNCPPGLAKKNNGCLPPGQAKKWSRGQPLGIAYSPLPPYLRDRLGPPPAGHQYVRVANDVLMIAVGSSLVIDAIEDLGSMR